MDESGFNLEHNPIKILATKGHRQVNARVSLSHQNIPVAACVDADVQAMTPLFVVKGKTSIDRITLLLTMHRAERCLPCWLAKQSPNNGVRVVLCLQLQ